jgi:hypothetical protein
MIHLIFIRYDYTDDPEVMLARIHLLDLCIIVRMNPNEIITYNDSIKIYDR